MEGKDIRYEEIELKAKNGMGMLVLFIILAVAGFAALIIGGVLMEDADRRSLGTFLLILGILYTCVDWLPFLGLKILKRNEALVLTLFGKYLGTLKGEGFFYVNPFVQAINPAAGTGMTSAADDKSIQQSVMAQIKGGESQNAKAAMLSKKISLKIMTLNNSRQKINDELGNPIEIGIVVIWRVVNTVKAVFNVDNYKEFLSIQCDSALRNIVRMYPYDVSAGGDEKSLRGSSQEIVEKLKSEIQLKVNEAGLEVIEARITYLAYAQEIAAVMLQRQQASAVIDARKMIVDGAVGMVEMALEKLSVNNIVNLDDERKAAMVSNLLVVLCGNKDAQPIVNSGSLY
jgi:regulator of protease activity HflC (stomatin/prohibitin superfamily)